MKLKRQTKAEWLENMESYWEVLERREWNDPQSHMTFSNPKDDPQLTVMVFNGDATDAGLMLDELPKLRKWRSELQSPEEGD